MTRKGTLQQVFIKVYRLEKQSFMLVFSTQLCELLPFSLSLLFNPLPVPSVNNYSVYCSVYTYLHIRFMQCARGDLSSGLQTYKHLPQSPFTGKFFQMTTFCMSFYESYLSKFYGLWGRSRLKYTEKLTQCTFKGLLQMTNCLEYSYIQNGWNYKILNAGMYLHALKVHKNENFFGVDFEFCPISLLVMHK